MNEKELGKAILKLGEAQFGQASDARWLTAKIVKRDRHRVRLLAGLTILFWLLAVAGVVVLIYTYLTALDPRLGAYAAGGREFQQDAGVWVVIGRVTAWIFLGCVTVLLLAAFSTVLLIFSSRRATLRQINASLMQISEQLNQLRQVQEH